MKGILFEQNLSTFWITFPNDSYLPIGVGVTAFNKLDAFKLMEEQGLDWHLKANKTHVIEHIRCENLSVSHEKVNMGPMQFRGVWYPCLNIGFGAPKINLYVKLKGKENKHED